MSLITKSIRYAIATAAAAAACTTANALPISQYATSANVNVYLSGSTAIDNTLLNEATVLAAPGGVCQGGTLDVYYVGTVGSYSNRLFYCTGSATSGATGQPIAIFKESNVGSANGVVPLIAAAQGQAPAVTFINPAAIAADASCSITASVAATSNGDYAGYTNHSGCNAADVIPETPTGGYADVEANILRTPTGGTFSTTQIGQYLVQATDIDVVWGVAVTKNLYYALQTAEHLSDGTMIATCNTLNNDSALCAPSLSKAQVAGIFSGNINSWTQLGLSNPSGDNNVYLCRRDKGSGTEASFEAYFLNARCSNNANVPMQNESTVNTTTSPATVWANGGTSGIRKCLQSFFSGGTLSAYYSSLAATEPGNQYALGIMSSEIKQADLTNAGDSFRLVAVDGVLPTLKNAVNGFDPYWSTGAAYQVKSTFPGAPSGTALIVLNNITKLLGQPAWTSISNAAYAGLPWGNGGDLAPADNYFATNPPLLPVTDATVGSNPTNVWTKNGSNCNTPVPYANTPVQSVLLGQGVVNN